MGVKIESHNPQLTELWGLVKVRGDGWGYAVLTPVILQSTSQRRKGVANCRGIRAGILRIEEIRKHLDVIGNPEPSLIIRRIRMSHLDIGQPDDVASYCSSSDDDVAQALTMVAPISMGCGSWEVPVFEAPVA